MRVKRLPIPIALRPGEPLVVQIHHALRAAIEDGRLQEGDALPSSRDLALALAVSRNTVLGAIALLVDEGLLETRTGAGTFVKARARPERPAARSDAPRAILTEWAKRLPARPEIVPAADAEINFLPGVPDLGSFPVDEWRRSSVRKLRTLRGRIGQYGPPEGDIELRHEIAAYVSRSRAVACGPDDIVITTGAQQAFDLIWRAFVQSGTPVAVEEPGYRPVLAGLRAAGAKIVHTPVDEDGIQVQQLPADIRIAYVTPSHQFPLGVAMSMARRREILEWADKVGAFIVEDDYDSEYGYSPQPLPSLQGADSAGRVIYVGTFSKILMPGIRLGYVVAPPRLRQVIARVKWLTDRHSEQVSQAVLADFMATGAFARHISKMQTIYAKRYRTMLDALGVAAIPGLNVLPNRAGLHLCAVFDHKAGEAELVRAALGRKLGLYGLASFFARRPTRRGFILGFGNVACDQISVGIRRLANLMRKGAIR